MNYSNRCVKNFRLVVATVYNWSLHSPRYGRCGGQEQRLDKIPDAWIDIHCQLLVASSRVEVILQATNPVQKIKYSMVAISAIFDFLVGGYESTIIITRGAIVHLIAHSWTRREISPGADDGVLQRLHDVVRTCLFLVLQPPNESEQTGVRCKA